jgi:hypothetical protein
MKDTLYQVWYRWTLGSNAGQWYDGGTFDTHDAAANVAHQLIADEVKGFNDDGAFEAYVAVYQLDVVSGAINAQNYDRGVR